MQFTRIVIGPEEPSQLDLQKFDHYMALVVPDDAMEKLVIDAVGFEIGGSSTAYCWLIRPVHLKTASPGSALGRLYALLRKHHAYGNIDHSFLASASRKDIISGNVTTGTYRALHLYTWENPDKRVEELRSAVLSALNDADHVGLVARGAQIVGALSTAVSAGELVKAIFDKYS